MTAPPPTHATAPRQRFDETAVRLAALVSALDGLGITDVLDEPRALLLRVREIETGARDARARARAELAELVGGVADGALSLDQAATRAAELAPWTPGAAAGRDDRRTPAGALAERVVLELRQRARDAAGRAGLDVHARLSRRAADAAKRGVEAGRRLVDVPALLVALRPPQQRHDRVQTTPFPRDHIGQAPPPPLSWVGFEAIQRDAARMAAWSAATVASDELSTLHGAAALLHAVTGGASSWFGVDADRDQLHRITADLPVQAHLAVYDALGWRPGLHLALKPGERRPPVPTTEVVNGVRQPAGWTPPAAPRIGAPLRVG